MTTAETLKTCAIFDTAANRRIVNDLEKAGAKVFLFPPLPTQKIQFSEVEIQDFTNLEKFDWLIFSDVTAVECFLESLEERLIDLFELDDLRVCAFGETVSDRLRFAAVHADVIPARVATAAVFSALTDYIGDAAIGGLKFLFVSDDSKASDLPERLRAKNAEVVELPVYRVIPNESSELIKLKTLLKGGAIDEFILTAPTDLTWLKNYFQPENLQECFADIQILASDSVMQQAAKENGLSCTGLYRAKLIK